jgi:hypothetical protein
MDSSQIRMTVFTGIKIFEEIRKRLRFIIMGIINGIVMDITV